MAMPRSRMQPNEMETVLREWTTQSLRQARAVCESKVEPVLKEEQRHRHKKFGLQTENITCYTCGKRFQNWKEHEAKQHCNVEGEILSGIICVASSSWTDACFLMKVENAGSVGKVEVEHQELKVEKVGGEGRRRTMEGGEQNVEKEEGEGGVKADKLPLVKVKGRKRSAPGEN